MLTGSIDALERLFMEQTCKAMTKRYLLHCLHNQLVVIRCQVCDRIDRCQLMLRRSRLVMLCLRSNAQFPKFFVQFFHKRTDALTDNTIIVVIILLAFRRHCAEQRTSSINQVFSL